jgi:O-antigen/teichoic acid export membrane protein
MIESLNSGKSLVVFKVISAGLQFGGLLLLQRSWTTEKLGIWVLLFSLGNFILVISDFGLGQALRLHFSKADGLKSI